MKSLYDVLGVSKDATADDIKRAFRRLARENHPDLHPGNASAAERFKKFSVAYEILSDSEKRSRYDITGSVEPLILVSRTASYEIERLYVAGDVADIYRAMRVVDRVLVAVKIARSAEDNDLLENETKVIKTIKPLRSNEEGSYRYFPTLVDSFLVESEGTRRRANVFLWLENFYSLTDVRGSHPELRFEHGVWMFNRVLEVLDVLHQEKKIVHGAVTPDHILVYSSGAERDPWNHGAKLVGWSAAVPIGQPLQLMAPLWKSLYPPEVLQKSSVTPGVDLYMAAQSILFLLRASKIPDYFVQFLRGVALDNPSWRPQNAGELHRELEVHMARYYGPKKYFPFDMPKKG